MCLPNILTTLTYHIIQELHVDETNKVVDVSLRYIYGASLSIPPIAKTRRGGSLCLAVYTLADMWGLEGLVEACCKALHAIMYTDGDISLEMKAILC
jgi:hypothetical protein